MFFGLPLAFKSRSIRDKIQEINYKNPESLMTINIDLEVVLLRPGLCPDHWPRHSSRQPCQPRQPLLEVPIPNLLSEYSAVSTVTRGNTTVVCLLVLRRDSCNSHTRFLRSRNLRLSRDHVNVLIRYYTLVCSNSSLL